MARCALRLGCVPLRCVVFAMSVRLTFWRDPGDTLPLTLGLSVVPSAAD